MLATITAKLIVVLRQLCIWVLVFMVGIGNSLAAELRAEPRSESPILRAKPQPAKYEFKGKIALAIAYDADGNRVSKSVKQGAATVTTNYLVDSNNLTGYAQVVEELQNGAVVRQYSFGLDLISQ